MPLNVHLKAGWILDSMGVHLPIYFNASALLIFFRCFTPFGLFDACDANSPGFVLYAYFLVVRLWLMGTNPGCRCMPIEHLLDSRVFRVYPNPNPNFRVPELSGYSFFKQTSGSNFENTKFLKLELPDLKFSGYTNAQAYSMMWICHLRHHLPYTFG